jgi:ATP-dependent Clp protease ATP-binding subunit ClpB
MGSGLIAERFAQAGESISEDVVERTKSDVVELLKQHLKPEFLNRIDEIVMFEPLGRKAITEIVDMQLRAVAKLLKQKGVDMVYTSAARSHIADVGFDALFGARPIKRAIQREVVNELSKRILAGRVDRTKPIRIDANDEGLLFEN